MMNEFTDQELLEKFRNAETKHYAFNLIVRRYQQRIYWHVRKIVIDHEDANDVVRGTILLAKAELAAGEHLGAAFHVGAVPEGKRVYAALHVFAATGAVDAVVQCL